MMGMSDETCRDRLHRLMGAEKTKECHTDFNGNPACTVCYGADVIEKKARKAEQEDLSRKGVMNYLFCPHCNGMQRVTVHKAVGVIDLHQIPKGDDENE